MSAKAPFFKHERVGAGLQLSLELYLPFGYALLGLACSRCKARKVRCTADLPACAACLRS